MKFSLNRTKKDCIIPSSALAVAGLKREKVLRLEVDNGVIVILRTDMNAKRLFAVSEFLHELATRMAVAVLVKTGVCDCCGDCLEDEDEDCECDYCDSREECRGVVVPDCLLEKAGIRKDQRWHADAENGVVVIRGLPDDEVCDIPDGIPQSARLAIMDNDLCVHHLRELLQDRNPIAY